MKITTNMFQAEETRTTTKIKNLYTKKLTKDETKQLRQVMVDNANRFTFKSTSKQIDAYDEFQIFLKDISYKGKPIGTLSQSKAGKLIEKDAIFGVKQTSQRIADFIIQGANSNVDLLHAGKKGMLEGFKLAEQMWGSSLPEISQKTMSATRELVDKALTNLGTSILDTQA